MPDQWSNTTSFGTCLAAACNSLRLYESRRRLPAHPSTRTLVLLDELQPHVELDLPAEDVVAVGQRHLPVEPPVAAVDRGRELDRCTTGPVGVDDRRPIRAACLG